MAHGRNTLVGSSDYLYGKTHSIDAAYALAWQQWEERETAVENAKGDKVAAEARLTKSKGMLALLDRRLRVVENKISELIEQGALINLDIEEQLIDLEEEQLNLRVQQTEAAAELIRAEAFALQSLRCYNKAIEEREFLRKLMNDLLPYCEFKDLWLSDPDRAAELAADKEWALEWCSRIENMLTTTGTIGYDHLESMKACRHYRDIILPHLKKCRDMLQMAGGQPLADVFLDSPLNIRHRLESIVPELAKGGKFSDDEKLLIEGMGTLRLYQQAKEEMLQPNPIDQHLALARPEDTVLALPMNITPEERKQFEQQHRLTPGQVLQKLGYNQEQLKELT